MAPLTPQQIIDHHVTRMAMEPTQHQQLQGEGFTMFQHLGMPPALPQEEPHWLVSPFTKSAGRSQAKQR